jgi:hypothetical protein
MEAVEVARRVRNPGVSANACYAAAAAIWRDEPQAALALIEDSLALTRAGAFDPGLGFSLALAAVIRARNGDLPGALAALGEAGPAAVLAGAVSAHFQPSISSVPEEERIAIDEAQALARDALGETAYSAALGRGAAMDDDQVVEYALGEFRRVAALLAEPGTQAPESPQASRS